MTPMPSMFSISWFCAPSYPIFTLNSNERIWCSSCDRLSPDMNAVIVAVLTECTLIADGGVARLRVYGHVYRNWADIATDEVSA